MGAEEDLPFSADDIKSAERLFGLEFSDEKRELMLDGLKSYYDNYMKLNLLALDNSLSPALGFDPRPIPPYFFSPDYPPQSTPVELQRPRDEDVAFLPITHQAHLLRSGQITSVELTELYLRRIDQYDPKLDCVITLTEELALKQAQAADELLTQGKSKKLLLGIPYGVKDLLSHPDFPTTWGATPYQHQILQEKATVISKLEQAGAVMVAKLSLGALAWGDVWFGGQTKSPYNLEKGSSGSSAGSAAAVSAGLVSFAIGTETWGSIVSPSTRCGTTGLRPTFGRVSRHGAMALAWSMDKIGPICRTVEDCALVFDTIYGPDGRDPHVISKPFNWRYNAGVENIRVGYDPAAFDAVEDEYFRENNTATLELLQSKGIMLQEFVPPDGPLQELNFILSAEAAAAFDEFTRSGLDDQLVRQTADAWPNVFRQGRLIPAVEYIRANRVRRQLIIDMQQAMEGVDVYLAPTFSQHLLLTNLTGHPCVVLPNGMGKDNIPTSITFIGNLFKEDKLLRVAKLYEDSFKGIPRPSL